MNINIPLIGKIIGSCLFSAASIVSVVNFKPPEEKTNEPAIEETTNQIDDTTTSEHEEENRSDSKEDVNSSQESGQGSTQPTAQVNTQVKSATKTTARTMTKPVSAPNTTAPAQTQPKQKQYTSVYDFEHAMLGICPQNVPSGVWPDKLRPIVSLGYRPEEKYGPSSAETAVAIWWSSYKLDKSSSSYIATATTGNQIGGDCGHGTDDTLFKMNYNTLTVYWEDNAITPNGKVWADGKAQYMTNFLRSINSQFKAKCGY